MTGGTQRGGLTIATSRKWYRARTETSEKSRVEREDPPCWGWSGWPWRIQPSEVAREENALTL